VRLAVKISLSLNLTEYGKNCIFNHPQEILDSSNKVQNPFYDLKMTKSRKEETVVNLMGAEEKSLRESISACDKVIDFLTSNKKKLPFETLQCFEKLQLSYSQNSEDLLKQVSTMRVLILLWNSLFRNLLLQNTIKK
jgi:hypothetical protein